MALSSRMVLKTLELTHNHFWLVLVMGFPFDPTRKIRGPADPRVFKITQKNWFSSCEPSVTPLVQLKVAWPMITPYLRRWGGALRFPWRSHSWRGSTSWRRIWSLAPCTCTLRGSAPHWPHGPACWTLGSAPCNTPPHSCQSLCLIFSSHTNSLLVYLPAVYRR